MTRDARLALSFGVELDEVLFLLYSLPLPHVSQLGLLTSLNISTVNRMQLHDNRNT